jgi:thymidylate synthase
MEEFIEKIKLMMISQINGVIGPIYGKQWRKWEYGDDKTFKNGDRYPSGEFMYDIRKEHVDQIKKY